MPILRISLLALGALLISFSGMAVAKNQPNIVFMLVDNFGYGDLGSYGGGVIRGVPTPRLDQLAAQGLRLTNFNVEPECTPSRSALLTGRMPIRSGTSAVELMGGLQGMTPWEYTLAELLADEGYVSAAFGKWHLGDVQGRYPSDRVLTSGMASPIPATHRCANYNRAMMRHWLARRAFTRGKRAVRVCGWVIITWPCAHSLTGK